MSTRTLEPAPTRFRACAVVILGLAFAVTASGADREARPAPNYKKAIQFGAAELRPFVYDTSIIPNWIGKTDTFWYAFRTSEGTNYYRVNPRVGTKDPLFDRVKLGTLLTETLQKPFDPATLPITRLTLNDEGTKLKFVTDGNQYEYDLVAETLAKLGKAPAFVPVPVGGRFGNGVGRTDGEGRRRLDRDDQDNQNQNQNQGQGQDQAAGAEGDGARRGPTDRSLAPDRKSYVFARRHNLYYAEVATPAPKPAEEPKDVDKAKDEKKAQDDKGKAESEEKAKAEKAKAEAEEKAKAAKKAEEERAKADDKAKAKIDDSAKPEDDQKSETGDKAKSEEKAKTDEKAKANNTAKPKTDDKAKPAEKAKPKEEDKDKNDKVTQLSTDGAEDYSFGGATTDAKARPFGVVWSKDSKSFYVTRRDARSVKELYLVNSLATPRPALEKYKYPLPGEEGIHKSELSYFSTSKKALVKVTPKWKEEGYTNVHWGKAPEELRFVRIDRLVRHMEFCALNVSTGELKCLISEGFENAPLNVQPATYLDDTDEMIWWSERSGFGHFYLYTRDGKLKNTITSGPYRTSRIAGVDAKNRRLYFTANGREPGENPNYQHLYAVQLDGTGLTVLDPGDANHRAILSPSRQFLVDNTSRVDKVPTIFLRRADGTPVMTLEKADLSRLEAAGWKLPETFVVKAADGVTDLYGNLWKPFDFDPARKYPIIVHVYPGPQQEGTTSTFTPLAGEQALAQIGFVVVQVGHRGGTPTRSKAYASYGYFNLRDYGLADKKSALEQLALRHPYIDIDRVGIFGHSGGGFMTAAAMLQKPYNEFFKVGVSSSGNHDNNVYGAYWAERYHGLKEVAVKDEAQDKTKDATKTATAATTTAISATERSEDMPGFDGLDTDAIPVMDGADDGLDTPADVEKAIAAADATSEKAKEAGKEKEKEVAKTKFEITVPTNAELAANLKGRLLLVHGDMDNNVHPAGTMRLVDALIKAKKRFDMLILPGKRHAYADFQPYFTQRMWEYFAEHLLGDAQPSADILDKAAPTSPGNGPR